MYDLFQCPLKPIFIIINFSKKFWAKADIKQLSPKKIEKFWWKLKVYKRCRHPMGCHSNFVSLHWKLHNPYCHTSHKVLHSIVDCGWSLYLAHIKLEFFRIIAPLQKNGRIITHQFKCHFNGSSNKSTQVECVNVESL